MNMLKMKNLSVEVEGKTILREIDLDIKSSEVHALLGPNASGKSTLAHTIMGFPGHKITEGRINFRGKDIAGLPTEERVKLGMALAFQHPPAVKEVKLSSLLDKISRQKIKLEDFPIDLKLLRREINVGFSGGERKLSEIIQVISLNPDFVIFDELDAGLDRENLDRLMSIIRDKLFSNGVSALFITHRGSVLRLLKPDISHVMLNGKIVGSSDDWRHVWKTIVRYGYEKCRECKLSPD